MVLLRRLRLLTVLCLSGCAIHPLPENFSGVSSDQMARQIRCETRDAVMDSIVGYLTAPGSRDPRNKVHVDDNSANIGEDLQNGVRSFRTFKPAQLSGYAKEVVGLIWSTGVAFNYNLQMTENNNNDASLDLLGGIPTSGRFFGFSSKFDLARQNTRIFTTADTLGKMAAELDDQYCSKKYIVSENIVYPLTGKIGIETVLQQFVQMAIFDGLTGNGKDDFTKPKGPAQMSEGLQFTTTLNLSATPKVVFAPATHDLHVLDASFTAQAIRADLHTLTIGLYVPKAGELDAIRGGVFRRRGEVSSYAFGPLASTPISSDAEAGALAAVNQALALKLFQAQVVVPQ
jgi:hypothetical protein